MITTVVGSYSKVSKPAGSPESKGLLDRATEEAIADQVRAGIDVVTDGQIRWPDEITYIAGRLEGIELAEPVRFFDTDLYLPQPVVRGPVRWKGPILVDDYNFACEVSHRPVKGVITGPYTIAGLSKDSHYGDFRSLCLDLAEALRQEFLALRKAGCGSLQVNEPAIVFNHDDFDLFREAMFKLVDDVWGRIQLYTYWGGIESLCPDFFDLPFGLFGLDLITTEGNWKALERFPGDKLLAAGIVDARNAEVESKQTLFERMNRVFEYVHPDLTYVNPNCGLECLNREEAFRKLRNMVDIVNEARKQLE